MSLTRHANIPIFIPHLGCPNDCVFCNQRSISGKLVFEKEKVDEEIRQALATIPDDAEKEIAFFGGSFTGIDRELMIYLLDTAKQYIDKGMVSSIRLSTRPDYISGEILDILFSFGVKTIELGLQSMDDSVLKKSRRGHDSDTAIRACRMIKERGFALVGQMMIGLPESTPESEKMTAKLVCSLGADAARIYPTVVFYNTELCNMAKRGEYIPLSTEEAVERSANVLEIFDEYNVPCIRVGLCASENLSDDSEVLGGANHSAVGELAMSRVFLRRIEKHLADKLIPHGSSLTLIVPKGCTSKVIGQKRINKIYLTEKYRLRDVKVCESDHLDGYGIEIMIK